MENQVTLKHEIVKKPFFEEDVASKNDLYVKLFDNSNAIVYYLRDDGYVLEKNIENVKVYKLDIDSPCFIEHHTIKNTNYKLIYNLVFPDEPLEEYNFEIYVPEDFIFEEKDDCTYIYGNE